MSPEENTDANARNRAVRERTRELHAEARELIDAGENARDVDAWLRWMLTELN